MKTEDNQWKTSIKPFYDEPIDLKMFGADVRIKKYKVFEDEKIKVIHIVEPTFRNEYNNYLELFIKNGAILMHFPIGGYINMQFAIYSAMTTAKHLCSVSNGSNVELVNKLI